ncbi:hypothetical protein AB0F68_27220 [Micromonospora sp. NPDC023966]|uniref:hypothetical protein n=1 Tax=Micromonospora sp. NPDC023966 TaxID=3154699 RepID=UPI0033E5D26F
MSGEGLHRANLRRPYLAGTIAPAFSHDLCAEPVEQGDTLSVGLYRHRPGQHVYVCGPPLMLAGARLRLLAAGVPAEHLHLPNRIPWR